MPPSLPRVRTAGAAGAGTPAVHKGIGKHAAAVAALGAVTLLAACGSEDDAPQPAGDDRILDKHWQVVSINTAPDAASTLTRRNLASANPPWWAPPAALGLRPG